MTPIAGTKINTIKSRKKEEFMACFILFYISSIVNIRSISIFTKTSSWFISGFEFLECL